MRRVGSCLIALLLGCAAPVLIWVGAGSAFYCSRKGAKALPSSTCNYDSDCPPGYICAGGRCVPAQAH